MWNRRTLLQQTCIASAALAFRPAERALAVQTLSTAIARSTEPPLELPADFVGLGYEMSSVAPIGLLSVHNAPYMRLLQQLGPTGVLRVGGIVADYTRYIPDGQPMADKHDTVINHAALEQFGSFLKRLNWTAIWSVNLAQGSLEEAVAEARAVAQVLGPSLQAFEIGNEIENYARGAKPFRTTPYTYEAFRAEFEKWRAAITAAVQHARFAGPDTASSIDWVERMAKDSRGEVQLLTTHYYRNNQQRGSAEQLARPDPKLLDNLIRLRAASEQSGIPWRMCETNSFSGGGRPGVSDTLLGALWTLDYMLLLAQHRCSGINLETGVNQLGFISSYSPIQDDGQGKNSAGVPYFGMLAFATARAGCTHIHPLITSFGSDAVTVYALGSATQVNSVVAVNRSSSDVSVSINELGLKRGSLMRLAGPASDSKTGITFAGATVGADGLWKASVREVFQAPTLPVPQMSAVVLRRS